jgi:hypothetical protein
MAASAASSPSETSPTSASTHCLNAKTAAHHAGGTASEHSPRVIDRTGERPCLPANALLAVCERLAEGGTPSLRERVTIALQQLRNRIAR